MAVTDSVTVWLGSKPPWPCQDQRPLALQSAHGPAKPPQAEEVATEHAAVCRLIVDNQAGALEGALGPEAIERTYLAMLNAEGIILVMHGLQW